VTARGQQEPSPRRRAQPARGVLGDLIPAALLCLVVLVVVFAARGITPLGRQTLLWSDAYGQYAPFLAHLRQTLLHGGSLSFSWDAGGGINTVGLDAYYLASPFNLIALAFPVSALPTAVTIIVAAKLATAAGTMSLYLRRAYLVPVVVAAPLSLMYALCGWAVVNTLNFMWLDALYLLPLLILAIRRCVERGTVTGVALCTAALLVTNFYVGFDAVLFSALYLVTLLVARGGVTHLAGVVARWALATTVGALVAGALLVPTVHILAQRPEGSGGLPSLATFTHSLPALSAKWLNGRYDTLTTPGTANVYVGILSLVLLVLFLVRRTVPVRERLCFLALWLVLALSCEWTLFSVVWQGFAPATWWPYRFVFVLAFLTVEMAARALAPPTTGYGADDPTGIAVWWQPRQIAVGAAVVVAVLAVSATTAGMRVMLTSAGLLVAVVLGLVLWRRHPRSAVLLLTALVMADMGTAAYAVIGHMNREFAAVHANVDQWRGDAAIGELVAAGEARTDVERGGWANDGFRFGFASLSHYSSVGNGPLNRLLHRLGVAPSSNPIASGVVGSTPVTDAVFDVGAVITARALPPGFYSPAAARGSYRRYRTEAQLPFGYVLAGRTPPTLPPTRSPFVRQNSLLGEAAADGFAPVDLGAPDVRGGSVGQTADGWRIRPQVRGRPATATWTVQTKPGVLYAWNIAGSPTIVVATGHDRADTSDPGAAPASVAPGTVAAVTAVGSRATIRVSLMRAIRVPAAAFATLSPERLARGLGSVGTAGTSRLRMLTAGHVAGQVTVSNPGTLVLPIGWAEGWHAQVDGRRARVGHAFGALLAVRVPAGDHSIELSYHVPGATAGLLASALGLFGLAALALVDRQRRSLSVNSQSTVRVQNGHLTADETTRL
jgi:uncharacterized membrane protein YfhO